MERKKPNLFSPEIRKLDPYLRSESSLSEQKTQRIGQAFLVAKGAATAYG